MAQKKKFAQWLIEVIDLISEEYEDRYKEEIIKGFDTDKWKKYYNMNMGPETSITNDLLKRW